MPKNLQTDLPLAWSDDFPGNVRIGEGSIAIAGTESPDYKLFHRQRNPKRSEDAPLLRVGFG
ncbi:MAG: hypothetical protein FJW26_17710 [Acidimicrobiia bacterium]|nr:hypothetical protein [Acidimicrobiia bacterium]